MPQGILRESPDAWKSSSLWRTSPAFLSWKLWESLRALMAPLPFSRPGEPTSCSFSGSLLLVSPGTFAPVLPTSPHHLLPSLSLTSSPHPVLFFSLLQGPSKLRAFVVTLKICAKLFKRWHDLKDPGRTAAFQHLSLPLAQCTSVRLQRGFLQLRPLPLQTCKASNICRTL